MGKDSTRRHLYLVPAGEAAMGPFERLGMRDRLYVPPSRLVFFLVTKLVLLGALLYVMYG